MRTVLLVCFALVPMVVAGAEPAVPSRLPNVGSGGAGAKDAQRQILIKVKAWEFSATKLKEMAPADPEIVELKTMLEVDRSMDEKTRKTFDDAARLLSLTEKHQQMFARVIAEPTLVAGMGREVHFHSGEEVPLLVPTADGRSKLKVGTMIDALPTLLSPAKAHLDFHFRFVERDSALDAKVNDGTIPGQRLRELDAGFEIGLGQTVGFQCHSTKRVEAVRQRLWGKVKEVVNEVRTLVFVTVDEAPAAN